MKEGEQYWKGQIANPSALKGQIEKHERQIIAEENGDILEAMGKLS